MRENTGVIILAATNRPESLDPALTRPGRFDRRVPEELPDLQGREAILKVHAKKIKVAPDVDFPHHSPDGGRRQRRGACQHHQRGGPAGGAAEPHRGDGSRPGGEHRDGDRRLPEENSVLSDKEKLIVSYHEIGHALVAAKQSHSAPVQKITIPRTSGALGVHHAGGHGGEEPADQRGTGK